MGHRGKSLKALREAKEIQLRRIASETRISLAYLQDLENERFDRFPGKFYFKSFAREYALSLGLDPAEVTSDLVTAYEESMEEPEVPARKPADASGDDGLFQRIAGFLRGVQSEV